jgi:hypothetical protein
MVYLYPSTLKKAGRLSIVHDKEKWVQFKGIFLVQYTNLNPKTPTAIRDEKETPRLRLALVDTHEIVPGNSTVREAKRSTNIRCKSR